MVNIPSLLQPQGLPAICYLLPFQIITINATFIYKFPYYWLMKQVKIVAHQHPDDLDLTVLLDKAIYFFSHYGKLLLAVALAGMLAGSLKFWVTPKGYASSLVLQPTMLSDPEQIELINNWSLLLKKKEYPVLAQQLKADVKLLKKVKSISAEELQKSYAPNNFTAFTLSVMVTDTSVLRPLQKGIVYGLNNSDFIKDKLASRKNILSSLIQTVQNELSRLNNIRTTVESNLQSGNDAGGNIIVDVSGISGQIAALHEKKLSFEENLNFTAAVNVLQSFYAPAKHDNPKLVKSLLLGLAGGLMTGTFIAFFIHVRRKRRNL